MTCNGPKKAMDNTVGKGENAGNQHFLLFPQCCLPILTPFFFFLITFCFDVCKFVQIEHV